MPKQCPGDGCEALIDDTLEFCTTCRRKFEQTLQANLHDIQAKLAAHRLFADWLAAHPEYE